MTIGGAAAADPTQYLQLTWLAFLLSLAMLSVGFLVSALTRQAPSVAVGISIFLWLIFVFLGDLGMMGTSMALRVPIANLFVMSLTNPLPMLKMAAILDIRATLNIRPASIYAVQRYGTTLLGIFLAVLGLSIVVPALLAYLRLTTRGDFSVGRP